MTGHRWVAVALAGAVAFSACSAKVGGKDEVGPSLAVSPTATASFSLPPNPYLSPFQKHGVKVPIPAPAPPTASACPTPNVDPLIGHSTAQPSGSWIVAVVDPDQPWEKTAGACPYLKAGADCWIPFKGGWRLDASDHGSIVFQVFENGSSVPKLSDEVGPVPQGGRFAYNTTGVPYKPAGSTRSVTFRLLLKDVASRVVASSEPETLPVPGCRFGSR